MACPALMELISASRCCRFANLGENHDTYTLPRQDDSPFGIIREICLFVSIKNRTSYLAYFKI